MQNRLVRNARRTVRPGISTLTMLCRRWGDAGSRRALRSFARSIDSKRPQPGRLDLARILAALTSGAVTSM